MINTAKIAGSNIHYGWDNQRKPVLAVNPGDEVEIELVDAAGGQIHPNSTVVDVKNLDFGKINPVTGPIYVNGASPKDLLEVEILGFEGSSWGWTAIIPGFGLLADEFPDPLLQLSNYDQKWVYYTPEIRLPYLPFPGTIGVAPAEAGQQSIVFPRNCGGNMDIRYLTTGSRLFLPVQVEGALFSTGDGHAAQGDGEVCGTAIETPLKMKVRFKLEKAKKLAYPQFETTIASPAGETRVYVTTGIAGDLMDAAKDAIRYMIDYLGKEYHLNPEFAYTLCSVAVDLKISEVVDAPKWIVTAHLDKSIFS